MLQIAATNIYWFETVCDTDTEVSPDNKCLTMVSKENKPVVRQISEE
jgi:hypothetical protein